MPCASIGLSQVRFGGLLRRRCWRQGKRRVEGERPTIFWVGVRRARHPVTAKTRTWTRRGGGSSGTSASSPPSSTLPSTEMFTTPTPTSPTFPLPRSTGTGGGDGSGPPALADTTTSGGGCARGEMITPGACAGSRGQQDQIAQPPLPLPVGSCSVTGWEGADGDDGGWVEKDDQCCRAPSWAFGARRGKLCALDMNSRQKDGWRKVDGDIFALAQPMNGRQPAHCPPFPQSSPTPSRVHNSTARYAMQAIGLSKRRGGLGSGNPTLQTQRPIQRILVHIRIPASTTRTTALHLGTASTQHQHPQRPLHRRNQIRLPNAPRPKSIAPDSKSKGFDKVERKMTIRLDARTRRTKPKAKTKVGEGNANAPGCKADADADMDVGTVSGNEEDVGQSRSQDMWKERCVDVDEDGMKGEPKEEKRKRKRKPRAPAANASALQQTTTFVDVGVTAPTVYQPRTPSLCRPLPTPSLQQTCTSSREISRFDAALDEPRGILRCTSGTPLAASPSRPSTARQHTSSSKQKNPRKSETKDNKLSTHLTAAPLWRPLLLLALAVVSPTRGDPSTSGDGSRSGLRVGRAGAVAAVVATVEAGSMHPAALLFTCGAYGLTLYPDVIGDANSRRRVEESSGDDISGPVVLLLRRDMAITVWIGGPRGVDIVIVIFRIRGVGLQLLLEGCSKFQPRHIENNEKGQLLISSSNSKFQRKIIWEKHYGHMASYVYASFRVYGF
ncbi:hypothetical protein B0H14DRAFT_3179097 [Mycena olivaceomarginata]|nr:hypothetical protein B0H14DRAFT_3179097 [Mycena olivaceomarginata]